MSIKYVDKISKATCGGKRVQNFESKNREIFHHGKRYTIINKEEWKASTPKRVFWSVVSVCTLGAPCLLSKDIQNICFKGKESALFAVLNRNHPTTQIQTPVQKPVQVVPPAGEPIATQKIDEAFNLRKNEVMEIVTRLENEINDLKAQNAAKQKEVDELNGKENKWAAKEIPNDEIDQEFERIMKSDTQFREYHLDFFEKVKEEPRIIPEIKRRSVKAHHDPLRRIERLNAEIMANKNIIEIKKTSNTTTIELIKLKLKMDIERICFDLRSELPNYTQLGDAQIKSRLEALDELVKDI